MGIFTDDGTVLEDVTAEGAGEYTVNEAVTVTAPVIEEYSYHKSRLESGLRLREHMKLRQFLQS